jgi:hypothetical protein
MDIGDIVGIKGFVFKTKTGELSVHAYEFILLAKSLKPLPEKFHGLTDTEIRYRQRYVDLIMNEDVKETFKKRSAIIREIRNFLAGRDFMEVETPMLVENAGGAAARPFITHYNALDEERKLRISLELYLKRLIVGGMERVFEIGRVFRNEGTDTRHNPEFTLMELYQAYTDYEGMMELTESMFRYLAEKVCGTTQIPYGDNIIDLEDRCNIGDPHPDFTAGMNINLGYKGFDFSATAAGAFGQQILCSTNNDSNMADNLSQKLVFGSWRGEGTSNFLPKLNNLKNINFMTMSEIWLEDADYVKIQNVTLGYDFKKLWKSCPLQQLRLYVSANNLFTFTGYSGMDPELGSEGGSGNTWAAGIDNGFYPTPRTYMVGVNVKF